MTSAASNLIADKAVVDSATRSSADVINILVVDDSPAIRDLIAAKLRELAVDAFEISIEKAESGEQAVGLANQRSYDLILLDVGMPGIGGLEACRQLKATCPSRIAMLSGMKSAEAHEAGRAAGCDNYLTKPPHDSDLRSILRLVSLRKMSMA